MECAEAATSTGERFGLQEDAAFFISYDKDPGNRIRSASGGALAAVAAHLLESGRADGVVASAPVTAATGGVHYRLAVLRSPEDVDRARSSHYHPLTYSEALREICAAGGRYAVTGTPCIVRGISRMPGRVREAIKYTLCLACSHNVTGRFLDCLARREGVGDHEPFTANLRDKVGGIPDANSFNNCFRLADRVIRRNRFETSFTDMWRNYFFTPECCLYCADFYGAEADLSAKDAWGPPSGDPLGVSLLVVRNRDLVAALHELRDRGRIHLRSCEASDVLLSQAVTAKFKHVEVRDRLPWKPAIRRELARRGGARAATRRWAAPGSLEYWRLRMMIYLSGAFYSALGAVPVKALLWLSRAVHGLRRVLVRTACAAAHRRAYAAREG